jgi:hypothetical protein
MKSMRGPRGFDLLEAPLEERVRVLLAVRGRVGEARSAWESKT